jgi:hypothetical protein
MKKFLVIQRRFNMDGDNKLAILMQLSGSPLQLLRNGGKVGIGGIGRLVGIILFFGFINLLLLIIALYKQNYAVGGLVLFLGLFCTIYAGKRAYLGIILDLAK